MLTRLPCSVIVAVACIALQACAVQHTVKIPPSVAEKRLSIGDEIVVALKSGKKYRATVAAMTDKYLITKGGRYAWQDIRYVSAAKDDPTASFLASIGSILAFGLIGMLLFAVVVMG